MSRSLEEYKASIGHIKEILTVRAASGDVDALTKAVEALRRAAPTSPSELKVYQDALKRISIE